MKPIANPFELMTLLKSDENLTTIRFGTTQNSW